MRPLTKPQSQAAPRLPLAQPVVAPRPRGAVRPEGAPHPQKARAGQQVARSVGHCTAVFLLKRELLSIFSAVYVFCEKWWSTPVRLWHSVRAEFRAAWPLLPLAAGTMTRQWSGEVFHTGASTFGLGCVRALREVSAVGRCGRLLERSRFRGELASTRRPRACMDFEEATKEHDILNSNDMQL